MDKVCQCACFCNLPSAAKGLRLHWLFRQSDFEPSCNQSLVFLFASLWILKNPKDWRTFQCEMDAGLCPVKSWRTLRIQTASPLWIPVHAAKPFCLYLVWNTCSGFARCPSSCQEKSPALCHWSLSIGTVGLSRQCCMDCSIQFSASWDLDKSLLHHLLHLTKKAALLCLAPAKVLPLIMLNQSSPGNLCSMRSSLVQLHNGTGN